MNSNTSPRVLCPFMSQFATDDALRPRVYPQRMSLTSVMEHHPTTALFQRFVPPEIIEWIFDFVDDSSLANLAQVNRGYGQLVRARRFAFVVLYDNELFAFLLDEKLQRQTMSGKTRYPSLGVCIRSIIVPPSFNQLDSSPSAFHLLNYLRGIEKLLHDRLALPNLEQLDWQQAFSVVLPPLPHWPLFSSLKNLKLSGFTLLKDFGFESTRNARNWHVSSLWLDVRSFSSVSTASYCANILRLCAHTLTVLVWVNEANGKSLHTFGSDPIPEFRRLRKVNLKGLRFADSSILDAIFNSRDLEVLAVDDLQQQPMYHRNFKKCGKIPSLKTFISTSLPLSFLRANNQISTLDFYVGASPKLIEETLTVLASFPNLRSLRIAWTLDGYRLSESTIALIGNLRELRRLCISVGDETNPKSWEVNHTVLLRYLVNLNHLQSLFIVGDSYKLGYQHIDEPGVQQYYSFTVAHPDDFGLSGMDPTYLHGDVSVILSDPLFGKSFWEARHKMRMSAWASYYSFKLPTLKMLYLGQLGWAVREGHSRQITNRFPPWPALHLHFGWLLDPLF